MQLTNFQRVCRLGTSLVTQPHHVSRYVRHNLLARSSPLELEIPWFSYAAIDYLARYLQPTMSVFEFGSGGSTIFFARRCKSVRAVEEESSWAAAVRTRAEQLALNNVEVVVAPFDFRQPKDFAASDYLGQVRADTWDVIVVDGADFDYTIRPICFRAAEMQLRAGGIIIVDDSWRYTQLRESNAAKRVEVFESVGPARFGVTSTDVYFY